MVTIKDKRHRAEIAVAEYEAGIATPIANSVYASVTYPELCVVVSAPIQDLPPYLKRLPASDHDTLIVAILEIILFQNDLGVETFLVESTSGGLYLVQNRTAPIMDASKVDFTPLRSAIAAAGITTMTAVLDASTVGYGLTEIDGTLTVTGANTVSFDLNFDPVFVACEFADWASVTPPSCNPHPDKISCQKVWNGTNWTISVTWSVQTERIIRWMAFRQTTNLLIFDASRFVPYQLKQPLDLPILRQHIYIEGDLEDTTLRDENMWIQDSYFALMNIITSRQWMRYFLDGHFDTMFSDFSVGDTFFQVYYNYPLLYLMQQFAQTANPQRFSISDDEGT